MFYFSFIVPYSISGFVLFFFFFGGRKKKSLEKRRKCFERIWTNVGRYTRENRAFEEDFCFLNYFHTKVIKIFILNGWWIKWSGFVCLGREKKEEREMSITFLVIHIHAKSVPSHCSQLWIPLMETTKEEKKRYQLSFDANWNCFDAVLLFQWKWDAMNFYYISFCFFLCVLVSLCVFLLFYFKLLLYLNNFLFILCIFCFYFFLFFFASLDLLSAFRCIFHSHCSLFCGWLKWMKLIQFILITWFRYSIYTHTLSLSSSMRESFWQKRKEIHNIYRTTAFISCRHRRKRKKKHKIIVLHI